MNDLKSKIKKSCRTVLYFLYSIIDTAHSFVDIECLSNSTATYSLGALMGIFMILVMICLFCGVVFAFCALIYVLFVCCRSVFYVMVGIFIFYWFIYYIKYMYDKITESNIK